MGMMKKVAFVILTSVIFSGCSADDAVVDYTPNVFENRHIRFDLIEDPTTGILYIDNTFDFQGGQPGHVYTPYYSENGKPCKYYGGKIVEISEE